MIQIPETPPPADDTASIFKLIRVKEKVSSI